MYHRFPTEPKRCLRFACQATLMCTSPTRMFALSALTTNTLSHCSVSDPCACLHDFHLRIMSEPKCCECGCQSQAVMHTDRSQTFRSWENRKCCAKGETMRCCQKCKTALLRPNELCDSKDEWSGRQDCPTKPGAPR